MAREETDRIDVGPVAQVPDEDQALAGCGLGQRAQGRRIHTVGDQRHRGTGSPGAQALGLDFRDHQATVEARGMAGLPAAHEERPDQQAQLFHCPHLHAKHAARLGLAEVVEREDGLAGRAVGHGVAEVRKKGMLNLKNVYGAGADQVAQLGFERARAIRPGDQRPTTRKMSAKVARTCDCRAGTHGGPLDPLAQWRQLGQVAGFIRRFEHGEEQYAVAGRHPTNEIEVSDGAAAVSGPGQAIGQPKNRLAPGLFSFCSHVRSQLAWEPFQPLAV